jgi:hypothetical protein
MNWQMTNSVLNARVMMMAIGTVAIALIVETVLRQAIIDSFRQRIFAIRRKLFLCMANGSIRSNDPEYLATEVYLNTLLRYAERLIFLRLLVGARVFYDHATKMGTLPYKFPTSQDAEASKFLFNIRRRATERVMLHMLETSPLAWLFVAVRLPIALGKLRRVQGVRRSVVQAMGQIVPSERIERDIAAMAAAEQACQIAA